MSEIQFHDAAKPWGQLSNFYRLNDVLWYAGRPFSTSEHLYQFMKFFHPGATADEIEYADIIRQADTPYKAKILASQRCSSRWKWMLPLNKIITEYKNRRVSPRPDWDAVRIPIMREILIMKFRVDTECREILWKTEHAPIAEHTTTDTFWADGGGNGRGQNMLGRLLVEVREQLGSGTSMPLVGPYLSSCLAKK